jgi:hypothetical protein
LTKCGYEILEMPQPRTEIIPSLTVHALLEEYPELEEVLIGIAPPFKKLRNPILRRTVARIATLKHISSVGSVPLNELIDKLREAVGQVKSSDVYEDEDYCGEQPDWFSSVKVTLSIDEGQVEDKDKMTLVVIMEGAKKVKEGEIIELVTSFLPAPGIDVMKSKGYSAWTVQEGHDSFKSYFLKKSN